MPVVPKVIVETKLDPGSPKTIETVQKLHEIRPEEIDTAFGVRQIRPEQNLYAIRVAADVAGRMRDDASRAAGSRPKGVRVTLVH